MPKDSIKPVGYQFPRQFIRQKKCIIIDPGFDGTHSILNTSSVHLGLSNILFFLQVLRFEIILVYSEHFFVKIQERHLYEFLTW